MSKSCMDPLNCILLADLDEYWPSAESAIVFDPAVSWAEFLLVDVTTQQIV
jgi:hypothetical protein